MRYVMLSLLALFLTVLPAEATENRPAGDLVPEVVPSVVVEAAPNTGAAMHLTEISVEERAGSNDAAAAQLGPRGGFWWIVGVIVVAGVILAVIL